jgi:hypothetical protein
MGSSHKDRDLANHYEGTGHDQGIKLSSVITHRMQSGCFNKSYIAYP